MNDYQIDKMARNDAKRFANAKMNYGKGAGNQRKIIKAEVESKRKTYPGYAMLFDHYLGEVDLGEVARYVESRKSFERKIETANRGYRQVKRGVRVVTRNTDLLTKVLDILLGAFAK